MERLTTQLLDWYSQNARPLPWRTTYEPYHILVSEFMLQQTQMERGVQYFKRWLGLFPTIFHVAKASEEEILHAWEGLGYYRRARYLHEIAKKICIEYDGIIPHDPKILTTFKGIGSYTVAALCGIGFNQPIVTIDANVDRVFSRLFCIAGNVKQKATASIIKEKAYLYLPKNNARTYNQSLMELGSLVCNKKPICEKCPIAEHCLAFATGKALLFPETQEKQNLIHESWLMALICSLDKKLLIRKRSAHLHWGGLFDFFSLQTEKNDMEYLSHLNTILNEKGIFPLSCQELCDIKYSYTNHRNKAFFYKVQTNLSAEELLKLFPDFMCIDKEELAYLALPSPYRKAIQIIYSLL